MKLISFLERSFIGQTSNMTLKEEIKGLETYVKNQVKIGADVTLLRSVLARLRGLEKKEPVSPYHNQAMGVYFEWLKIQGLPEIRNASQGGAMKSILSQLKDASIDKTDEAAYESFKAILSHWKRLNVSLQKSKSLASINKNLLEIIDKIKNGSTKHQTSNMEAEQVHGRIRSKYNYGDGQNG
ncbi:hypothetical protein ACR78S_20785 [Sphingobacterium multivorum]|uniref:hypothetical protein n=2 Tax=Sphingobacterium multivorum TaxID=28454 RepID=UPI003DA458FB